MSNWKEFQTWPDVSKYEARKMKGAYMDKKNFEKPSLLKEVKTTLSGSTQTPEAMALMEEFDKLATRATDRSPKEEVINFEDFIKLLKFYEARI